MPEYQNVDVNHPKIVEYAKNMIKGRRRDGTRYSTADVAKVVGMPHEVIRKIERDVKREGS